MPKHKEDTIPITLHPTPAQIEASLRQVTGADQEDWMNDPRILRMLAGRDRQITDEIWAGKFATLAKLQAQWDKRKTKAKKRPTR